MLQHACDSVCLLVVTVQPEVELTLAQPLLAVHVRCGIASAALGCCLCKQQAIKPRACDACIGHTLKPQQCRAGGSYCGPVKAGMCH